MKFLAILVGSYFALVASSSLACTISLYKTSSTATKAFMSPARAGQPPWSDAETRDLVADMEVDHLKTVNIDSNQEWANYIMPTTLSYLILETDCSGGSVAFSQYLEQVGLFMNGENAVYLLAVLHPRDPQRWYYAGGERVFNRNAWYHLKHLIRYFPPAIK